MNRVRRARPLLGTLTQISVAAPLAPVDLHAAVDAAFGEIAVVHALMSWHDADSELSRLNRCAPGGIARVHAHTRAVLDAALRIARLSDGAFDPCTGATLARWGLLPRHAPSRQLPPRPPQRASWRDIELTDEGVRFHRPVSLDLGGIAKGYAVDLAVQRLLQLGIREIVVNAGGDLRVAGTGEHTAVIRHPCSAHAPAHSLRLHNEALATSSAFGSERQVHGGAVCALVDPATDRAYAGRDSVSVRAATCMTADALTKVALFGSSAVAAAVFEACRAQCIRLEPVVN